MKKKFKIFVLIQIVIILSILYSTKFFAISFNDKVNKILNGGTVITKNMSTWELYQYKYTTLLRKSPMQYCPWESYKLIRDHVYITDTTGFRYALTIDADLKKLLRKNAIYNRNFARQFQVSGTKRQKIQKIFSWCCKIKYNKAYHTTRDAFERRQSACAGIAGAFYVLCKVKHIPVHYVIGWVDWGGGCHAWNQVKISGKWYWIDATYGWWLSERQWQGRTVMEIW